MSLIEIQTWLRADWRWILALTFTTLAGASIERYLAKSSRRMRWSARHRRARPARAAGPRLDQPRDLSPAVFDAAKQLRVVERASFSTPRLLNRGEQRLFDVLERACAAETAGWRVMAQVSLGEILSSPDEAAYRAINSKRVDLLLVAANGVPRHAIELQGSGHHLGPAATRDAVKKEALRKAGIGYVEVLPGDTPAEVHALVAKLARR